MTRNAMKPDADLLRKSDLNVILKVLKEHSGMVYGYSYAACKSHDFSITLVASNMTKHVSTEPRPLIIDSGASHHMISDSRTIKDIQPALGHVLIANGDKIPIKGI